MQEGKRKKDFSPTSKIQDPAMVKHNLLQQILSSSRQIPLHRSDQVYGYNQDSALKPLSQYS